LSIAWPIRRSVIARNNKHPDHQQRSSNFKQLGVGVEPSGRVRSFPPNLTTEPAPMSFKFLGLLKKKTPPDLWQFALDVREVMVTRISRGLSGRLSADEARRMVVEKQTAATRAHLAYMRWLFDGNVAAANDAVFNIYHRAVQSNRKRLRRRRWGWPIG
jgi:hypothetical protein